MSLETVIATAFATWYVAYAVTCTHGPFNIFDRIRKVTTVGGLLECPVCLAFWAALALVWVTVGHIDIVLTLGCAGLAMLAHGFAGWRFGGD